jgi:MFS family permease
VRAVLANPRLRRIVLAYGINRLGTWFGTVALALGVYDHTHSALEVAAVLIAAQVLPAFVVPAVIARVETSKGRHELSGLLYVEAVAIGAVAVLLSHFWLPAILLLVAVDGTAALAANALLRTELAAAANREIADPEDPHAAEQHANAALNVIFSVTFVLGPILAGLLVASAGAPAALFVDVASFAISGTMLLDLHPHVEEAAGESVRARVRAAWHFVRGQRALLTLLLAQGVGLIFFESAVPIEVAYVKRTLVAGDGGYGLLVTAWGVGVVLGSIIFARAGTRSLTVLLVGGTLAIGCGYIGFAIAPTLALAAFAAVVGGIGNGVQYAPVISGVQRLTPPSLQGRVMGLLESISAVAPAMGLALGGLLVAVGSPRLAFAVVGGGAVLTAAVFARVRFGAPVAEPLRAERSVH